MVRCFYLKYGLSNRSGRGGSLRAQGRGTDTPSEQEQEEQGCSSREGLPAAASLPPSATPTPGGHRDDSLWEEGIRANRSALTPFPAPREQQRPAVGHAYSRRPWREATGSSLQRDMATGAPSRINSTGARPLTPGQLGCGGAQTRLGVPRSSTKP